MSFTETEVEGTLGSHIKELHRAPVEIPAFSLDSPHQSVKLN
jgi:hypothetical protein